MLNDFDESQLFVVVATAIDSLGYHRGERIVGPTAWGRVFKTEGGAFRSMFTDNTLQVLDGRVKTLEQIKQEYGVDEFPLYVTKSRILCPCRFGNDTIKWFKEYWNL